MIYLVHIPVYAALAHITPAAQRTWWLAITSAALSISIAALSWRFMENPILSRAAGRSCRNRETSASAKALRAAV